MTSLAFYRRNFFSGEPTWQNYFEHLNVFAVTQLAVTNAWRLMDTRARFQPHDALAFVFELDPAFQDVDELELRSMKVRLARECLAGCGPNDVGVDSPVGRLFDTEVRDTRRTSEGLARTLRP